jgi:hypothetical protein
LVQRFQDEQNFSAFLSKNNSFAISGILIYPRFIPPNPKYGSVLLDDDIETLQFEVISTSRGRVIYPISSRDPYYSMRTGMKVIMIGCRRYLDYGYYFAEAILIYDQDGVLMDTFITPLDSQSPCGLKPSQ